MNLQKLQSLRNKIETKRKKTEQSLRDWMHHPAHGHMLQENARRDKRAERSLER